MLKVELREFSFVVVVVFVASILSCSIEKREKRKEKKARAHTRDRKKPYQLIIWRSWEFVFSITIKRPITHTHTHTEIKKINKKEE